MPTKQQTTKKPRNGTRSRSAIDAIEAQRAGRRRPGRSGPRNGTQLVAADAPAVWMSPSELVPWERNPRNNAASVPHVRELIARFGFGAPVVARAANREIIAGHTRVLAATELGLKRIPVRLLDISAKDAHMLALADNRATELTPWTAELSAILSELELPDLELAGWTAAELDALMTPPELPEAPDDAEDYAGRATFGVYSWERVADAYVLALQGGKHAEQFKLSVAEIMVELNRCAAGNKPRVTLADRWFPHRYDVLCGNSSCTPNESLQQPDTIRGAVELLAEMKAWPITNLVLRTIMLYRGRQTARQFPLHTARDIYRKYSAVNARVLDPCAGWGGRLLGWYCSLHSGSYTGFDASALTCKAHARMIAELTIPNASVQHAAFEDVRLKRASFDFAFTSPPYFSVERYSKDAEQSCVRYAEYDAWRSGFLLPLVRNTLAALRPGGAFVLNVSDAGANVIAKDVEAIGRDAGARVEANEKIDTGAGSSGGLALAATVEDLIVLRKPDGR